MLLQADKTFLQSHLGNSVYLKGNESAVAENFLNAFKNYDIELLDKARGPGSVMYVDPDFQDFARALSFMGSGHPAAHSTTATAKVLSSTGPAPQKQLDTPVEDLQASLESIVINEDGVDPVPADLSTPKQVEEPEVESNIEFTNEDDDDDEINLC